ncbi:hypothetical protein [Streptomyces sp. NPDC001985]|uniref:hypothetical protein n=1 Tax=Streptomyces sp. NPDC001985 TaxID=3154406 RepID=UPI00331BC234
MSSGQKTMLVFLTLIGGLLLTILGLHWHWPFWAWSVAGILLVTAPVAAVSLAERNRDPFPVALLREPDLPVPPVERRELRITEVALPSSAEDYDFLFSATVRWCPVPAPGGAPPIHACGLAVDSILERARAITSTREPGRASLVQHELDGELATMCADSTSRVQAMALDVALTLADEDRERLAKLAAVRKDEAVWEHERKYEQSRRAYLGEDVLKDTSSAVVWWLHRNDDRIDRTVKDLGLLAQLTSVANDEDVMDRLQHLVAPERNDDPPAGAPADPADADSPLDPSARRDEPPPANDLAFAFSRFLRDTGLSPESPETILLAEYVAQTMNHHDEDQAAGLKERFGSPRPQASPPEQETDAPAPPESPLPPF